MPTNTTPYPIDVQQFLDYTANHRGYGYYMHLAQPQEAYRFVVSIRSSGGHGYLIANSKNDPSAGDKVADFTFDASGVTDVKFKNLLRHKTLFCGFQRTLCLKTAYTLIM